METRDLLIKFAKANGLKSTHVDEFLAGMTQVNTLEDLEKVPDSLLTHYDWIGEPEEAINEFIKNEMWAERHQTIDLDNILDCLYDRLDEFTDGECDDFEELEIENYEANRGGLEVLVEVKEALIKSKFGSVRNDW